MRESTHLEELLLFFGPQPKKTRLTNPFSKGENVVATSPPDHSTNTATRSEQVFTYST